MAGGGFGSTGAVRHYEGKVTAFVVVTCIVAATGGLIFGYDIGISGGVTSMDVFLKKFFPDVHRKQSQTTETSQYCKFDSQLLTLFTSSLYLAALFASFFASVVTRIHGRKISMFIGGLVFLCGSILNAAAVNLAMLIIGRILLGIGVGFANQSVPLYLSEMAPAQIRGALNIGFQVAVTTGNLVANVINYGTSKIGGGWGWRISLGLAAVPALILTLGSILLPDTPASILERGHPERAKQMLIKIRGTNNVEEELEDMHEASEAAKIVENPWRNILQTKYRPQLVFCIFIPFFQQFTGINVIMFYAPILFKTLGFSGEASLLSSVLTGGVNLACTFISVFTVDKFGRRGLFLEGGVQMVVAQVVVAVMIGHVFGTTGTGSFTKAQADVLLLFICLYVAAFAWSWGPLGWLVPSEICPLEIRSAAQALNVSVNMLFTFLVAQFFVSCLCHMKFGLFLFFAGFVITMTIFIYFLFPETKNVPIEEIELVWKEHWFWGSFIPDDALHPYPPNIQLHSRPVV